MAKIGNIAKNTSYLTLALILQKVISFSYFTLLARYVGPAHLGKYYLAISFTTIFAIFIDLGFANILTREIAKNKEKASLWLANILGMKIPLSVFSIVILLILVNYLGYDGLTKNLVYISMISMVLDSFTSTFFAVIRGHHNLKYESISSIVFQLIVLIVGYAALLMGGGLMPAIAALAIASIYNFVYSWLVLRKYLQIRVYISYSKELAKEIMIVAWPFAAFAIFQRLYTYLDSVILSVLAGDEQVGLYQVAFKIIFALQFLPSAFTASLYPAMSAYWENNREQLAVSFERAMNYLIIISLPIIVGAVVLADKIVLLFKSGYTDAAWPLRISIISLFFIFVNFPIGSLLNACDAQKHNTWNMGIVTIISVVMNFMLIPYWQAAGASFTVLVTNFLMFILGMYYVRKIIVYRARKNLIVFGKVITASLVMGVIIFFGSTYLNVFVTTLLGGLIYFLALFALGGFSRSDIMSIVQSFKRSSNKNKEIEVNL